MTLLNLANIKVHKNNNLLLDGVSCSAASGEILAVIGANGAGKSTLVNVISGELSPRSGKLQLNGQNFESLTSQARAQQIGIMPQYSPLNFPFRVAEVVALGRTPHTSGAERDKFIVEQAIAELDLNHLRDRRYTELSGGEKQRTQLARVFSQVWPEPNIAGLLILDEPSASLDIGHKQLLMHSLRNMAQRGLAILWIEHDLNLVAQFADRILALSEGKTVAYGATETCLNAELIKEMYAADVEFITAPPGKKRVLVL